MADAVYNKGKRGLLDGTINLTSDTIKVILVSSSYTFDADHDFADDVAASEIAVTGYTGGFGGSGRKTLASKAFATDNTGDAASFDAADLVWTTLAAGVTLGGAVLVKEVTNDAASPIIAFLDPANIATNGGDVTLAFNVAGILKAA
jgi:hypothetical protein